MCQALGTTNLIESSFSLTADLCRNVKRWRDANMVWRWAGMMLAEAQGRFRRVRGYRLLGLLTAALKNQAVQEENAA